MEDLTGKRYGRLVVLRYIKKIKESSKWECICDCGNTKYLTGGNLRSGSTKSCGCLNKELIKLRERNHGLSKHPLYQTYFGMLDRCFNKNLEFYHHYGGRGIIVCDRWREPMPSGFLNFLEDMEERPEGCELDRRDNDLGYFPENCRWVLPKYNNLNRRGWESSSSKYKGVFWYKRYGKWVAQIGFQSKNIRIGLFSSEKEAAIAYNTRAISLFGEYAYLNNIEEN